MGHFTDEEQFTRRGEHYTSENSCRAGNYIFITESLSYKLEVWNLKDLAVYQAGRHWGLKVRMTWPRLL